MPVSLLEGTLFPSLCKRFRRVFGNLKRFDYSPILSIFVFQTVRKTDTGMTTSLKQTFIWIGALVVGAVLGLVHMDALQAVVDFIATVYTRLFQFLAVPTIALAIITTLISFGREKSSRKIFSRTITYTLLTTFAAALVGMLLFILIAPENIPPEMIPQQIGAAEGQTSFRDHWISVIPDNIVRPFLSGNVLSVLIIAVAFGLGISFMKDSPSKTTLVNFFTRRGPCRSGRKHHPVRRSASALPSLQGNQSPQDTEGDESSGSYGPFHEELRSHPSRNNLIGRRAYGSGPQGKPLRSPHLLHSEHERMRRIHPRHFPFPHAERRDSSDGPNDAPLGGHFGIRSRR